MQTLLIASLSSLADLWWYSAHLHNLNALLVPLHHITQFNSPGFSKSTCISSLSLNSSRNEKLHPLAGQENIVVEISPLWCHQGHWWLTVMSPTTARYCSIQQSVSLKQIVFAGGCKQTAKNHILLLQGSRFKCWCLFERIMCYLSTHYVVCNAVLH